MSIYKNIMFLTMEPRLFDLDLQLLNDVIINLVAILVLFGILSYFLFEPVRNMLQKRQDKIETQLNEAAAAEADAATLKSEYEGKIANIDQEAEAILSEARKLALASENQIIAEAKEEAHRIMERAKVEAELEKAKLADEVKKEMISIASVMAGKVVSASMTEQIQDSLIDETLKEMGEGTWLS